MRSNWLIITAMLLSASPAMAAIEVETTSVGHGVRVWYAENNTVPVVDVQISFEGAGSASDAENKSGRAAFAAAMLTEGAGALDSSAFKRALEEQAISIEAQTSEDRLTIHIHCLRENAKRAGELLALALSQPQFAAADVARVKGQFESLFAQLAESPNYQANRLLEKRAFAGHPYANEPYGTAASIQALQVEDAREFLKTYVTRGNVLITAAGDADSSLLDDMLRPVVEALPENDSGAVSVTPITMQGGGETLRQVMPLPQSVIAFAAPSIARDDPRFYAAHLLNHILGGNALLSRLSTQLRQQKGLVYGAMSELDVKRGSSVISGYLATRNNSAEAALSEVKTVLTDIHDKGVTTEECNDAKSYVLGSQPLKLDSSSNVASTLMMMRTLRLGEDYLEKRESYFSKVSCADINSIAEELLVPSKFLFATVGGTADAGPGPSISAPASGGDAR